MQTLLRILLVTLLSIAPPSYAAKDVGTDLRPGWSFSNLHVGAGMALQGGGSSFSALLRYVPEYRFNEDLKEGKFFGAGLDLGFSAFHNAGRSTFGIVEISTFGSYHLDENWDFRLFVGAQQWTDGQGVALFLGPKVLYHMGPEPESWGFDGFYASYDAVFHSKLAHILSLGAIFNFGAGSAYEPPKPIEKKPEVAVEPKKTQEEKIQRQKEELSKVVDATRTANGLLVNLKGDMTFATGSSKLSSSGSEAVGKMGAILAKYPTSRIRVEGHSDSTGSASSNLTLSQARAEGVRDRLVQSGVLPSNISAKGFGMTKPVTSNNTADGRATNRRVEIYIDTPATGN